MKRNITGENIQIIRNTRKISQEQLAAKLNLRGIDIDQTIISRIENQTREILDFEVKSIADILGVKVQDLFELHKNK
ncbi:helix-turn-helix domain-containing protein [Clostridium akagii]|uniref:helix-turn-helix domain-containing protein n=1 Tax=Clostridium akagii TaxID=91623 RepID=UPI00047D8F4C|nr:helix-turn-helix transcriptional regulator [Clostridium akagii]